MTCPYSPPDRTLSSYHDRELSPALMAEVEAHLLACGPCTAELARLRKLSAAFASASQLSLSPMGHARILRNLRGAERNRQLASLARPFAAAASLILAVGLPLLLAAPAQSSQASNLAGAPVWEATLLTRDSETLARSTTGEQLTEWVAADLSTPRR